MNKMTVLVVDDTRFMRETIKKILRKYDVETFFEAENGLEAVDKYTRLRPELVIMDIAMPIMDGIESIKRIVKINPEVHILVCSTLSDRQKVIEAVKEGAAAYILKPPHEDKLIEEINNIFIDKPLIKSQRIITSEVEIENNVPTYNTDYEIGYRAALIDVGKRLINDKIEISKVCSYLNLDDKIFMEELLSNLG